MDADDPPGGTRADAGAPTAEGTVASVAVGNAPTALHTGTDETIVPSFTSSKLAALPDPGYQIGEVIGRGGMGEVVTAQDLRIGREVAIKRIRDAVPSPDAMTRFLREARIQARLDHPAIVPVYELGTDAAGRPYFTMKRLAGETLTRKLSRGGPVQPLLRAFVDVCLAMQLAHSRGVVHRDLKPANIMLGDYGEVYVLDWGVARVITDRRRTTQPPMAAQLDEGMTAGSILGTPGYMAPEQVRGAEADGKADVYALGAILFEILTGEALHPRGEAALSSTLTNPQEAPARRVSERTIAPELDSVCYDALAEDPASRPSARELADRVQAYLDGDRDVERRRTLAQTHIEGARAALKDDPRGGRAVAMLRAGRALALDPESTEAAELISTLVLEPPDPEHRPPDLEAYLSAEERKVSKSRSRQGMWTYLSLFLFWGAVPFMHVTSWTSLIAFYGLLGLATLSAFRSSLRGYTNTWVTMVLTGAVATVFTRIAGPLMLTPIVICAALMQLSAIRYLAERWYVLLVWCVVVVMLPFVLEWTGLMSSTLFVSDGFVVSRSDVFDMRGHFDQTILIITNLVFITSAGMVAVFISRRRLEAQERVQILAWHLHQLLPTERRVQTSIVRRTRS